MWVATAEVIRRAMIRMPDAIAHVPAKMLLQVHDELIFDLHPEEEATLIPEIIGLMETALPLPGNVPLLVEHGTGPNWLEAH